MLAYLRRRCVKLEAEQKCIHLAKISIKSIWRQLTKMWGGREESRISEINSPRPGEKVLLLPFSRVIEDCRKVNC